MGPVSQADGSDFRQPGNVHESCFALAGISLNDDELKAKLSNFYAETDSTTPRDSASLATLKRGRR
jgi:hypothetical protein